MQRILATSKPGCLLMIVLLIIEWIPWSTANAGQEVNIRGLQYGVVGNEIVITYDMSGPDDQKYKVSLTLKKRLDSAFSVTPVAVSGDIGAGCTAGTGKKIVWNFLKDFPNGLDGTDYYFKMDVEAIDGGSSIFWWIVGGAAVTGGAAALMLKSSPSQTEQGLPKPIGRP